jgi:hypothetical protein
MPKTVQKKRGGRGRRSTVLQDQETMEAVCLAEIGKGNTVLRERYGIQLSDGQFQYRLTLAKNAAGMAKGDGFRRAWREGRSSFEDVVKAVLPTLRKDYQAHILPQVERPTPKVSPNSDK